MSEIDQTMDQRKVDFRAVALLDELERRALSHVIDLIDGNHLDEARQVIEIIQAVGIV